MTLPEIKQQLKSIFEADFQGVDLFVEKVIEPIFEDGYTPLSARKDILEGKSKKAVEGSNIISAYQVGEIDTFTTIRLYDITLADNANIARSRVGIQRFVRQQIPTDTQAFILFHYEHPEGRSWRLSYLYKNTSQADTTPAKRYTYLFSSDNHARTAIERFATLVGKDMVDEKPLLNAFSVETLSDEFFYEYREHYADFVQYVTGKRYVKQGKEWKEIVVHAPNEEFYNAFGRNDKRVRDYVKKMMGRLVFLCFLQRKGWMGNSDNEYLFNLYANSADDVKVDFLDRVLEPMFFGLLNTKPEERAAEFARQGWDLTLIAAAAKIPYLNGGLFEQDDNDKVRSIFPCELFSNPAAKETPKKYTTETFDYTAKRGLFDFFSAYNFTIDENDPDDAEVGVDPEMLGRIFESLLEDNKDKGAFYTPKEIVQYMCRESLIAYLQTDVKDEGSKALLRNFVTSHEVGELTSADIDMVDKKLREVKICDPAIGSGAFPMGLLRELFLCRSALEGFERSQAADIKRHIIQNNIYGVDFEKGAVDIARLRFWLSLIIDEESPRALPNLDFKIMQGNSLLEQYKIDDDHTITLDDIIEENQKQVIHAKENSPLFVGQDVVSNLKDTLHDYYNISDHDKKRRTKLEIEECVRRYIETKICRTYGKRSQVVEKVNALDKLSETKIINSNFFLWHTWFADVFEEGKGFDIVIGNPPYIEFKNLSAEVKNTLGAFVTAKGKYDLYIPFLEHGFNISKPKGITTYICPTRFMKRDYGTSMRQFINERICIEQIFDFEDLQVFDNAMTYTGVFMFRNEYMVNYNFAVKKVNGDIKSNREDFINKVTGRTRFYNSSLLSNEVWNFSDYDFMSIYEKVSNGAKRLEDVCEGIYQGIASGKDDVFFIDQDIINHFQIESNIIHRVLKGKDIGPYKTNWSGRFVIYPYDKDGKVYSEEKLKDDYPNVYKYLITRRQDLSGRGYFDKSPKLWFELWNQRKLSRFLTNKIITLDNASKNSFTLDTEGYLGTTTVYSLVPKSEYTSQIRYMLGILNSSLLEYIHKKNTIPQAGGFFRYQALFIKGLPIKFGDKSFILRLESLVDHILAAKKANPLADTTAEEREIDRLVYDLYGLTEEEIAIVEGTKPENEAKTKESTSQFAKEFLKSQTAKDKLKTAAKGLITG